MHGRDEIAEVPTLNSCGGAACTVLGYTGTEILPLYFDALYNDVADLHNYDQIQFYEMGRSFWFWGPQLAPGWRRNSIPTFGYSVFTGFAVLMRYESMRAEPDFPYAGTDFWASIMWHFAVRHGGQLFLRRFFHHAFVLSRTRTVRGAVTNWVRDADYAACVNLKPLFYRQWGFPRPDGRVTPRPPGGTVHEPRGSCRAARR